MTIYIYDKPKNETLADVFMKLSRDDFLKCQGIYIASGNEPYQELEMLQAKEGKQCQPVKNATAP